MIERVHTVENGHAALRNIQSDHQGQVNEMHTNFTAHKP